MSEGAAPVEHDSGVFRGDPTYEDKPYSAEAQLAIYGGKSAFDTPRPLLEIGRQQYTTGPFDEGINLFGEKNLVFPGFAVYGDWRTAVAYNDNGALEQGLV
ncbi:MAG: hypothetical protein FJX56_13895, partial [Alphaproteobacteria bacterium]|nr:hypothetical protein [Alphaproteobacteria bacterium]